MLQEDTTIEQTATPSGEVHIERSDVQSPPLRPVSVITSPPPTQRPAWKPDNSTEECRACNSRFTLYMRKHHCRNCGEIYCALCCGNKVPLEHLGYTHPERVCKNCIRKHYTDRKVEDINFFAFSLLPHDELQANAVSQ